MKTVNVKFQKEKQNEFAENLNKRIDDYFAKNNCNDKANLAMIIKLVVIGILFFGSYALLLSNAFSETKLLLLAILFGFSKALIAFNISHDASHYALFKNKKLNELFSYSFNLIGVNRYIWHIKHNLSHHSYTNIPGYDMDIEQIKIARLVPHVPMKWYYRFQHIYVPMLYPFLSLFMLVFKDFQMFATKKYGINTFHNHPRKEYFILIFSKLFYILYAFIIPFYVIKIVWWKFLIGFFVMHFVLGIFLAIILFPVHALEDMPFPEPNENGIMKNSWLIHEFETSTNFAAKSRIVNWISGGLNTHIIHHIKPSICHIHYYELTKIIRTTAKEHHIEFKENSLLKSIQLHLGLLKKMGRVS